MNPASTNSVPRVPGAARRAAGVLLLAASAAAGPAGAVSLDPGSARVAAAEGDLLLAPPSVAQHLQLDADLDLGDVVGPRAARDRHTLDGVLHRPLQDDAALPRGGDDALAGELLPGLALSAAPLVDYADERDAGPSVMEVLRSVVTVSGEPAAAHGAARAASPARGGGGSMLGLLQPLAVDLLEASLTDRRMIDGTMVFSILGRGAFVVEAARDGSGLVLSELRSGFGMVLGRDPAARRPRPAGDQWEQEEPVPVAAHWRGASTADSNGLRWFVDAVLGVFHGLVRAVVWVATTPLALAIAIPVLLAGMIVGAVRRAREYPRAAVPAAARAAPGAADAAPRAHRRRHGRRRGGWSMLVGQLRESIGFPDADTLRGGDFTAPRGRAGRPSPKSA